MIAKQISLDEYMPEVVKNLAIIEIEVTAKDQCIQQAKSQIKMLHDLDDGKITIAVKRNKEWFQYHYSNEELKEHIGKILSIEGINIYLSPNSFYKPKRAIENVRKLNSLYIDLDYYKLDKFKELSNEQIIWILENDYFNKEVPEPNFIVLTGRGLAIYWLIEPVPYKALPLWNAVQKHFLERLKDIGADENSIDSARVMRLAGAKNQKNGTDTELLLYNDEARYRLKDIQENYLPRLTPYIKQPGQKSKGRKAKVVNFYTVYSLHYARLRDIVTLQKIREGYCRNEDGQLIETGQREFMCFLYRYWSCCYESDKKNALNNVLEFNKEFKNPLSENEVIKQTKYAENGYDKWLLDSPNGTYSRGGYNYKNDTLINKLNITSDEMKELETIIDKNEVKRRTNIRTNEHHKSKRRNEKGLTKREQDKEDLMNKIQELKNKGYTQSKAAIELEKSIRTIKSYW